MFWLLHVWIEAFRTPTLLAGNILVRRGLLGPDLTLGGAIGLTLGGDALAFRLDIGLRL